MAYNTHGMSKTKLYKVWAAMLDRCYNDNLATFNHYGGRGIKVHERLHTFQGFMEVIGKDYKPGLTLDRIDNNKDYEPGNLRWVTMGEQSRNKSSNRKCKHPVTGKETSYWDLSREYKINYRTLLARINRGYSLLDALTPPKRQASNRLPDRKVREIREMLKAYSVKEIATKLSIGERTINGIKTGIVYGDVD